MRTCASSTHELVPLPGQGEPAAMDEDSDVRGFLGGPLHWTPTARQSVLAVPKRVVSGNG